MSYRTTSTEGTPTEPSPIAPQPRSGTPTSILVGVAGGSGAGKTTVVREVVRALGSEAVSVIHHDAYYRDLSGLSFDDRIRTNFDHPDSLETELLTRHMRELLAGRVVEVPTYDFATHTRRVERRRVSPTPIVLLDGILVLADAHLRALMDLAVFVHADAEARLARRVRRDTEARGRSRESVVEQFHRTVRPMHDRYVEPSREHADLTILEGGHNRDAIERLVRRIESLLRARG